MLAYVGFFLEKYFCNVKGTDIDCSMCSTILPSGDSSGTTLEVPSEALLHRSKLQCSDAANSQYLSKNIQICEHNEILRANICLFESFFVTLQPN